jgi:hypothetical protein
MTKPKRIYKVYGRKVSRAEFWRKRDEVQEQMDCLVFGKMSGFDIYERRADGTEKKVPQR